MLIQWLIRITRSRFLLRECFLQTCFFLFFFFSDCFFLSFFFLSFFLSLSLFVLLTHLDWKVLNYDLKPFFLFLSLFRLFLLSLFFSFFRSLSCFLSFFWSPPFSALVREIIDRPSELTQRNRKIFGWRERKSKMNERMKRKRTKRDELVVKLKLMKEIHGIKREKLRETDAAASLNG